MTFLKNLSLVHLFAAALLWMSLESSAAEVVDGSSYGGNSEVKVSLLADVTHLSSSLESGDLAARVGVLFEIKPGWHIYWKESGDSGLPTTVTFRDLPGWELEPLFWPTPQQFVEAGDIRTIGYTDEVLLWSKLHRGTSDLKDKGHFRASVTWLACSDVCIPGKAELALSLPISSEPSTPSSSQELFENYASGKPLPKKRTQTTFLAALLLGFLAGMLLNLMPCVLPVIGIKVMSFISQSDKPRAQVLTSSFFYALGILATFWALAISLILLKNAGLALGWGFQFQHPMFVLGMFLVIVALSLGFFDLYAIELPGVNKADRATTKLSSGLLKSFFEGALTTALATPCTAPFLGTALAFAFTQSAPVIFVVFTSIGLGLAFPYVLLSAFPAAHRFLPKPGAWMNVLKHFMGFLLLGTSLWLLFVLEQLAANAAVWALLLALIYGFLFWLYQTAQSALNSFFWRAVLIVLCAIGCAFSTAWILPKVTSGPPSGSSTEKSSLINWEPFSEDTLRKTSQVVFIDFTADWCVTCKANETLVIETQAVASAIRENNILPMKADWTSAAPEITAALEQFGGTGVPYYVVVSPDKNHQVLPVLLTKSVLIEALASGSLPKAEE